MGSVKKLFQRKGGIAIGLVLSLLAGLAQFWGWLDPINNFGLDLRFRWFGDIPADPRIVLIDIDDGSIRAVGEYPWPRRFYADILNELENLGADRIVLDMFFTEPARPRVEYAALSPNYDLDPVEQIGDPAANMPIYDDDELAVALSTAYLPMVGRPVMPGSETAENRQRPDDSSGFIDEFFDSNAAPTLSEFLDAALPPDRRQMLTAQREELIRAFRAEAARRAWLQRAIPLPDSCAHLVNVADPEFPLDKFAFPAAGIGFIAYEREKRDGVLRSVPMAVRVGDRLVLQLGVLAGINALWRQPWVFCDGDTLRVGAGAQERVIPLDASGLTMINWNGPPKGHQGDWRGSFVHLPASRLLELAGNRRTLHENEQMKSIRLGELVETRHAETPSEYRRYVERVLQLREIRDSPKPIDPTNDPGRFAEYKELREEIERAESDAVIWLARAHAAWSTEQPRDDAERAQRHRIRRLYQWFGESTLQKEVEAANRHLSARIAELAKELQSVVGNKICLVGYTATGVGDLVTTPIHPLAPGVMVHANIINMVLQNRFVRSWAPTANAGLVGLAALLVAMIACAANWRVSLAALLLVWAGLWALGAMLFVQSGLHVASLPAVAGAAVAWSGVTWYRQSTEERARRRLQIALTQYTSPEIAIEISERVQHDALAPRTATVTCFFSDLDGFTRLSERLGPARTRDVLNPYLELTSRILIEQGAIVNKFVGDGVFAFFNAPIRPCEDHARNACMAARLLLQNCPFLSSDLPGEAKCGAHRVRIGLSSGEVFVGDYGSQAKLDYTCIGDAVNLGSRLEQINKVFGTTVLLDGATRRLAGEDFEFRPLGLIQVHGRAAPAEVYEMVVMPQAPDARVGQFAAAWEHVLRSYQSCQWETCGQALSVCRRMRPDDRAAALYFAAMKRWQFIEPRADWNGALDLDVFLAGEDASNR